jgi:hypothetical protein
MATLGAAVGTVSKTAQISFRVPVDWIKRADILAPRLAGPGNEPSRSAVFRDALMLGIKALEARTPRNAKRTGAAAKDVKTVPKKTARGRSPRR